MNHIPFTLLWPQLEDRNLFEDAETCMWLSEFMRMIFDIARSDDKVLDFISKKVSEVVVQRPSFIGNINIKNIHLGSSFPTFNWIKHSKSKGLWHCSFNYKDNPNISVETQLEYVWPAYATAPLAMLPIDLSVGK